MAERSSFRARCRELARRDYTQLPEDRPNPDEVYLTVDVTNPAPPGTEATEAAWVVRYS